jgi:hypothetical protein
MAAEMWTALDQSYAGLSDTISPGAARLLIERLEEERTQSVPPLTGPLKGQSAVETITKRHPCSCSSKKLRDKAGEM